MLTAGIDLASKPSKTAVCVIDWCEDGVAEIKEWERSRWTDARLIEELMSDPSIQRIGVDAPFGWPTKYVNAISASSNNGTWPEDGYTDDFGRFRETELNIKELIGTTPLSSSLGNLSWVTRRCVRLLARQARDEDVKAARLGEGCFVEVYPAASLKLWGISPADLAEDPGGYKGEKAKAVGRRRNLAEVLVKELESVVNMPTDFVNRCEGKGGDDLVDALIAALVARAMARGRCEPIPANVTPKQVKAEGWIRVPRGPSLQDDLVAR